MARGLARTVLCIIKSIAAAIKAYSIFSAMTESRKGPISSFYGTSTIMIKCLVYLQICIMMRLLQRTGMVLHTCSTAFHM